MYIKRIIELVRIGKSLKVNWRMNFVGIGLDEIYFFKFFKLSNFVVFEIELKKWKRRGKKFY